MKTRAAFWDTSALVPLCVFQEATSAAQTAHREYSTKTLWWGTAVEVRSAFARLKRTGEIETDDLETAVRKWIEISKRGREIRPTETLLDIAVEMPGRYELRALDSFQLAAALEWCGGRTRNRPFITADVRLGKAAGDAGFNVISFV